MDGMEAGKAVVNFPTLTFYVGMIQKRVAAFDRMRQLKSNIGIAMSCLERCVFDERGSKSTSSSRHSAVQGS